MRFDPLYRLSGERLRHLHHYYSNKDVGVYTSNLITQHQVKTHSIDDSAPLLPPFRMPRNAHYMLEWVTTRSWHRRYVLPSRNAYLSVSAFHDVR